MIAKLDFYEIDRQWREIRDDEDSWRYLSPAARKLFQYNYFAKLRPQQNYPEIFRTTDLIVNTSGRGSGKSYSGAVWLLHYALHLSKPGELGLFLAPTDNYWDQMVVDGNSLDRLAPPQCNVQRINSSGHQKFYFPPPIDFTILFRTGQAFDRARGINASVVLFEEFCMNRPDKLQEIYETVFLGVRKGSSPKVLVSSTPKPSKFLSKLVKSKGCTHIQESTYANQDNLAPQFIAKLDEMFKGSLFGRQEIEGVILDSGNAIMFDETYKTRCNIDWRTCQYLAISIDPANTEKKGSDETGIIVYGVLGSHPRKMVVFRDLSGRHNPSRIKELIVDVCRQFSRFPNRFDPKNPSRETDIRYVVAETNSGGHWIEDVLKDTKIPVINNHSLVSKACRVETCNPLWQGGQILLNGQFYELEDQLENFTSGTPNDDRVDALTQGCHDAFDLWNPGRDNARSMNGIHV